MGLHAACLPSRLHDPHFDRYAAGPNVHPGCPIERPARAAREGGGDLRAPAPRIEPARVLRLSLRHDAAQPFGIATSPRDAGHELSAQTLRRASGMSARAAKSWLETVVVLCHNPQSWAVGRTPASISLKAVVIVREKPGRGLNSLPILEKGAAVSPEKTMCRQ
jgi:hypothetical protein